MENISKEVLKKIQERKVVPIPKWQILLKSSFVWGLFTLNIVLGSVGFGIVLYLITNNDVLSDLSLKTNTLQWIILAFPLAWIGITILFLFVAYYNFKHTDEGYRFGVFKIFLINIVAILGIGTLLYFSGLSEKLNTAFATNIPLYTHTMDTRMAVWMRPQDGYLAGEITSIDEDSMNLQLVDLNGKKWVIEYVDALIKGRVDLAVGEVIKIAGDMSTEKVFKALEIRPWHGMGMRMQ